MCIKNDSQIFILTPLLQGFNRSININLYYLCVHTLVCNKHLFKWILEVGRKMSNGGVGGVDLLAVSNL